ncbi:HNH endonuclease [Kribbella sp. NPDC004536]|uniref:HNH endonuclease n=1 Tax=Kribbella sp. NPDC004536 TaxID=3364106 RepID=UPI0036A12D30
MARPAPATAALRAGAGLAPGAANQPVGGNTNNREQPRTSISGLVPGGRHEHPSWWPIVREVEDQRRRSRELASPPRGGVGQKVTAGPITPALRCHLSPEGCEKQRNIWRFPLICTGCGCDFWPPPQHPNGGKRRSRCDDCRGPRAHLDGREYRALRKQVLAEETHCHICKMPVDKSITDRFDPAVAQIDHVIPVAARPDLANERSNLRLAHRLCNQRKAKGKPVASVLRPRTASLNADRDRVYPTCDHPPDCPCMRVQPGSTMWTGPGHARHHRWIVCDD